MPNLTVSSADESTEIFVVASNFELRARGALRVVEDLETGIYKIRAVTGRSEWQKVVALREDTVVEIPRIAFGSAAPLAGTNRTHESHMAAAELATPPGAVPEGGDRGRDRSAAARHAASFVFMARWWTPWSAQGPQNLPNPANGASLGSGGGRRLMRLDAPDDIEGRQDAPTDAGPHVAPTATWFNGDRAFDRYSGVSLRADDGLYTLGLSDGDGQVEQMITLLPGWRTYVFALYEPPIDSYGNLRDGQRKKLVDLSIHMTRDQLSTGDEIARLTDAARLALADERSTATGELMSLVRGKFENPMLGLYGAHLLLLLKDKRSSASVARPFDYSEDLFREVVENIAAIFGPDHPDIVALRGESGDGRPITAPPMLWRSWLRLLQTGLDFPDLVQPPIWRRTALRALSRPFFCWRVPQYGGERVMRREIELVRLVLSAAEDEDRLREDATSLRNGTASLAVRDDFVRKCVARFEAPRSVIDMILN